MSRGGYRGPKLPHSLLHQVGATNTSKNGRRDVSRTDRRKAERQDKKSNRGRVSPVRPRKPLHRRDDTPESEFGGLDDDEEPLATLPTSKRAVVDAALPKSILKKTQALGSSESEDDLEPTIDPQAARRAKRKLEEDDADIAALEKKLGMKSKKSKALEEDGLDWLAEGSGSGSEDGRSGKRKRPEDTKWLRDKRLKATGSTEEELSQSSSASADELEDFDAEESDNLDSDSILQSDEDPGSLSKPRQRENPYVAPVSSGTKYVPPSLRQQDIPDDHESLKQLRRQVQGLLNRLSEANLLSILKSVEEVYSKNPRQHVTTTLVDLLVGLVADAAVLNETFLILHAGFSSAVYKIMGTDFGAVLLENLVEKFDRHYRSSPAGKQSLNIIAFLSNLYMFQLVGSNLIFDCIRLLLSEVSETNTELLLRIIRIVGQQLRQDDPSSLKDIVLLLQRSITAIGELNVSVRTKFMIETINDLKNNRMKTGTAASTITAEHTARMKKTLSSLGASRSLKAVEPLRISLADIRDSEKKGKWWLVGASYLDPRKEQSTTTVRSSASEVDDNGYESETPGSVNPMKLARAQGMNTDVRRAIFVTTVSSGDYREAHERLIKLHLKAKQQLEIPRVLVHCVGAEAVYNPFYALVAKQFCSDHKLRKSFQFALWDCFQEMEGEDGAEMNGNKLVNVAKFYASLVANKALDLICLKKLDFAAMAKQQVVFVELFLTTVLVQLGRKHKDQQQRDEAIAEVFARAAGAEGLPQGLILFMENVVTDVALARGKKEKKFVRNGCDVAVKALRQAMRKGLAVEDDDDDESDV